MQTQTALIIGTLIASADVFQVRWTNDDAVSAGLIIAKAKVKNAGSKTGMDGSTRYFGMMTAKNFAKAQAAGLAAVDRG